MRVVDRGLHARGLFLVCLAPRGTPRVDQARPVLGVAKRSVAHAEGLALKVVARLDHARLGAQFEPEGRRDGRRGLLSTLKRRSDYVRNVKALGRRAFGRARRNLASEVRCDAVGHRVAEFGQVIARESSVQDSLWVEDFAVAHQMDRGHGHGHSVANFAGSQELQARMTRSMIAPRVASSSGLTTSTR